MPSAARFSLAIATFLLVPVGCGESDGGGAGGAGVGTGTSTGTSTGTGTGGTGGAGGAGGAGALGGAAAFTRVFFDDFEDGTTDLWQQDGAHPKGQATQTAPHAGSYAAVLNWNGTVPWNDPDWFSSIVLTDWPYEHEMLVRFWWRFDEDVDRLDIDLNGCNGIKINRIGWQNVATQSDALWTAWTHSTDGGYLHQVTFVNEQEPPVANYCGGSTDPFDAQWHQGEFYVKHDTNGTDGVIAAWFDDEIDADCYPFVGQTYNGTTRWNTLHFPSNWSQNCDLSYDAANHLYIDDVEIFSDSSSGTPALGSMADGTAYVP